VGSGRGVHGKENPRRFYAVGLRAEPAPLVRGRSHSSSLRRLVKGHEMGRLNQSTKGVGPGRAVPIAL
jgi:hypothetical protein